MFQTISQEKEDLLLKANILSKNLKDLAVELEHLRETNEKLDRENNALKSKA